ncbi:MAG: hypothetical protein WKF84_30065 [Pyrinomonadaceae bacterium]
MLRKSYGSTLVNSPDVDAVILSPSEAQQALRSGAVALVIAQSVNQQAFDYRFDPTRPESRLARLAVDDTLQRQLGRRDVMEPREERISEPGARYIDFLIPGLIGMNLMGSGLWGLGFTVVQAALAQTVKALCGDAHAPLSLSAFFHVLAACFSGAGSGGDPRIRMARLWRTGEGLARELRSDCVRRSRRLRRARFA